MGLLKCCVSYSREGNARVKMAKIWILKLQGLSSISFSTRQKYVLFCQIDRNDQMFWNFVWHWLNISTLFLTSVLAPYLLPLVQLLKMKSPFLKKDTADFFHKIVEQTLEVRHEDKVNPDDNVVITHSWKTRALRESIATCIWTL